MRKTLTPDCLDLHDPINAEIWTSSPALQASLDQRFGDSAVVAAQSLCGPRPLPWVPDLVGHQWTAPGGLVLYGSAYADFFSRYAKRNGKMAPADIRGATVAVFQRAFVQRVVLPDASYYGKIEALLAALNVPWTQVVLTDICRASLVRITDGRADAKESSLTQGAPLLDAHLQANLGWHHRRLVAAGARVLVGLGDRASRGLLVLLARAEWRRADGSPLPDPSGCGWVKGGVVPDVVDVRDPAGRAFTVVKVPHPNARQKAPVDAAPLLASLLSGEGATVQQRRPREQLSRRHSGVSAPVPRGPVRRPPAAPSAVASRSTNDALWREVFQFTTPLPAGELLALSPDARARTARLLSGISTERVVAITNAMYNACRPKNIGLSGLPGAELAWQELWKRKDQPYSRTGTQWERTVQRLGPMPDWAAKKLLKMDIMELADVARAVHRGPYLSSKNPVR